MAEEKREDCKLMKTSERNYLDSDSGSLYSVSTMAKTISELTCKRCGHRWYPRKPEKPRNCANKQCNSPYWDRPRRKVQAEAKAS